MSEKTIECNPVVVENKVALDVYKAIRDMKNGSSIMLVVGEKTIELTAKVTLNATKENI